MGLQLAPADCNQSRLTQINFAIQSICDLSFGASTVGTGMSHTREQFMRMKWILMSICLAASVPVHAASSLDLTSSRGRVVYLDFWASWCGPCRQSFPWMETMKSTYEAQGLEIITVNLDTDRANADKFLREFHPTLNVRFDPKGELAEFYKVQGMPSSVLIDRHGVTRFTHVGFRPVDGPVYEAQVRELLAEK
jgi:cytochrome c biogenesis protein CcmG, thiol:disulfide interchange protein DsbE